MKVKKEVLKDAQKVLNRKIVIEKLTTVTGADGFKTQEWLPWETLWASKNNLFGKEFYAAKAVGEEKTVVFEVRYFKDIEEINTKEYRILHGSEGYDITFIDNVKYQNQWIKIKTLIRK